MGASSRRTRPTCSPPSSEPPAAPDPTCPHALCLGRWTPASPLVSPVTRAGCSTRRAADDLRPSAGAHARRGRTTPAHAITPTLATQSTGRRTRCDARPWVAQDHLRPALPTISCVARSVVNRIAPLRCAPRPRWVSTPLRIRRTPISPRHACLSTSYFSFA